MVQLTIARADQLVVQVEQQQIEAYVLIIVGLKDIMAVMTQLYEQLLADQDDRIVQS